MSTNKEVDLYLEECWTFMRSRMGDPGAHAWMNQQRTNFMLLRSSMQRLLPRYRFVTTSTQICCHQMIMATLTPLMYEEVCSQEVEEEV